MQRIIDGFLYQGVRSETEWAVTRWRGNGHAETSIRPAVIWTEVGHVDDFPPVKRPSYPLEDALKCLEKAARRAQTMCRRVIKVEGFNQLLTITYRDNQQDRDLCKLHFKKWVERMKRALGGEFRYCAAFERQERGAMHVHVACHKLPKHVQFKGAKIESFRLGTSIWRSIVGSDNGLVFVGGKKAKKGGKRLTRSPAKMAQYVSKYIMKDFADSPSESNRYSRSNGSPVNKPEHLRLTNCGLSEAISVAFECFGDDVVVSHRLGDFRDSWWLCTEPSWLKKSIVIPH